MKLYIYTTTVSMFWKTGRILHAFIRDTVENYPQPLNVCTARFESFLSLQ